MLHILGKLFSKGDKVDPRPLALPAGMELPETAEQKIERMIRTQLSRVAVESGEESFEDANDFDVDDDDPTSHPTSHEMASEFMEGIRNASAYDDSRQVHGGHPERSDRNPEESERTQRDGGGSSKSANRDERTRETGEEDEPRAPAGSRRHDSHRDERFDRRGREDEPRRENPRRSRDGRDRNEG